MVLKKKTMRLPEKMMLALLSSLFGALLCFAFVTTPAGGNALACKSLAGLTQFLFLSSLAWSNAMAISIAKSLTSMHIRNDSVKSFILFSLYALGLPLFCTLATLTLSEIKSYKFYNEVYETDVICFMGDFVTLIVFFLAPAYILILLNFCIGVFVMMKVMRSGDIGAHRDKNRMKKHVITCFKVSACLGLSWIFLLVATFEDSLWPAMQVSVELQGVILVIANSISWKCLSKFKSWTVQSLENKRKTELRKAPTSSLSDPTSRATELSDLSTQNHADF